MSMHQLAPGPEERLYERIAAILDEARSRVARTVNTAMVHACWLVDREIVEVEQGGKERAEYGEGLMKCVAARLSARFGKGFSLASLERMKQFYLAFPSGSALVDDPGRKTGAQGSTASSLSGEADPSEKGSTALSLSASTPAALFPPTSQSMGFTIGSLGPSHSVSDRFPVSSSVRRRASRSAAATCRKSFPSSAIHAG